VALAEPQTAIKLEDAIHIGEWRKNMP